MGSHGKYIGENIKHDHEEVIPYLRVVPMLTISSRSTMTTTRKLQGIPTSSRRSPTNSSGRYFPLSSPTSFAHDPDIWGIVSPSPRRRRTSSLPSNAKSPPQRRRSRFQGSRRSPPSRRTSLQTPRKVGHGPRFPQSLRRCHGRVTTSFTG